MLRRLIDGTSSVLSDLSNNVLATYSHPQNNHCNAHQGDETESVELDASTSELCSSPFPTRLTRSALRLVIFSEQQCGRLIYDSATVISLSDRIVPGSHRSTCGQFQFLPHSHDTDQIAKMMFGTLDAGCNKPGSIKIHPLPGGMATMLTGVFTIPSASTTTTPTTTTTMTTGRRSGGEIYSTSSGSAHRHELSHKWMVSSVSSSDSDHQCQTTVRSLDALRQHPSYEGESQRRSQTALSYDRPPEGGFVRVRNSSLQVDELGMDAMYNGGRRVRSTRGVRALVGTPAKISRQRREQLSLLGLDKTPSLTGSVSCVSALGSLHSILLPGGAGGSGEESLIEAAGTRRYGAAVIFPSSEDSFLFQHILQVERDVQALLADLRLAISARSHLFFLVFRAWRNFTGSISLLHDSPRLISPAWLTLTSNPTAQEETATKFCAILAGLSKRLNTKEKGFFLATLLSAALANHLAWVSSVAPPASSPRSHRPLLLGTCAIDTERSPFYNAHLAQLLDLTGGHGAGSTRIVILAGENRLLAELLFILSYFIRCSSIRRQTKREDDEATTTTAHSPVGVLTPPDSLSPLSKSNNRTDTCSTAPAAPPTISTASGSNNAETDPPYAGGLSQSQLPGGSCDYDAATKMDIDGDEGEGISPESSVECNDHFAMQTADSAPPCLHAVLTINITNSTIPTTLGEETTFDFGKSLLAALCPSFSPHFIISGIKSTSFETDLLLRVLREETHATTSAHRISLVDHHPEAERPFSNNAGAEGGQRAHDSCGTMVLADVSSGTVRALTRVTSSVEEGELLSPSETVASMLDEFVELHESGCIPTFLISFLEDCLRSLVEKSNVLVRLVSATEDKAEDAGDEDMSLRHPASSSYGSSPPIAGSVSVDSNYSASPPPSSALDGGLVASHTDLFTAQQVSSVLGCDNSDLGLIIRVASTYSPYVLSSVV